MGGWGRKARVRVSVFQQYLFHFLLRKKSFIRFTIYFSEESLCAKRIFKLQTRKSSNREKSFAERIETQPKSNSVTQGKIFQIFRWLCTCLLVMWHFDIKFLFAPWTSAFFTLFTLSKWEDRKKKKKKKTMKNFQKHLFVYILIHWKFLINFLLHGDFLDSLSDMYQ